MNTSVSIPFALPMALAVVMAGCSGADEPVAEEGGAAAEADAATTTSATPAPLESVRNFQIVDDRLASAAPRCMRCGIRPNSSNGPT